MGNRIVITGLGIVSPNGLNIPDFLHAIQNGISGIRFVPEYEDLKFNCQVSGMPEFEWEQLQDESHVIFDGGENARRIDVPDTDPLLIPEIAHFTKREKINDPNHVSFLQGAGHGGSHPHLAHVFIQAVLGKRAAFPDAPTSANWTIVGLCAHESALKDGEKVKIPAL